MAAPLPQGLDSRVSLRSIAEVSSTGVTGSYSFCSPSQFCALASDSTSPIFFLRMRIPFLPLD